MSQSKFIRARYCTVGMPLWLLCASLALGYELDTHALMTFQAFERSAVAKTPKQEQLGLTKSRKASLAQQIFLINLGSNYYDMSSSNPTLRGAQVFDQLNTAVVREYGFPAPAERWDFTRSDGQQTPYFPRDWLVRGVVREDDVALLGAIKARVWEGEANALQQLDSNPQLNRVCNHFYDPVSNKALDLGLNPAQVFACNAGEVFGSAVAWSLGNTAADGSGAARPMPRLNGFSVLDAREAMWRALTGTDAAGTTVAPARVQRDTYWATTFRALGSVIHNLQDMGQPQHALRMQLGASS
jgi:hypothetical protein